MPVEKPTEAQIDTRAIRGSLRAGTPNRDTIIRLCDGLDAARKMLAECYILSGADTDGNTLESGWEHLWDGAVEEVRILRAQSDDHSDIEAAETERDAALRRAEVAEGARDAAREAGANVTIVGTGGGLSEDDLKFLKSIGVMK